MQPLLLEPRTGLRTARAKLDALAAERGLQFRRHDLELTVGTRNPVTFRVTVYLRSIVECFKEFAAQLLPEHCALQH